MPYLIRHPSSGIPDPPNQVWDDERFFMCESLNSLQAKREMDPRVKPEDDGILCYSASMIALSVADGLIALFAFALSG